jgi:hypothetical protein
LVLAGLWGLWGQQHLKHLLNLWHPWHLLDLKRLNPWHLLDLLLQLVLKHRHQMRQLHPLDRLDP